jgi:glycosyltransferase involved in cell wall biosynthesis
MIKVLHITWAPTAGGTERLILDIIKVQKNNEQVLNEVAFAKSTGNFLKLFKEADIKYYCAGIRSGWDFNLKKYFYLFQLFKTYDILQIHDFNPIIAACVILSKKKIVYSEHGNFGTGHKLRIAEKINQKLLKYFLNYRADIITFDSVFTKEFAEKKYNLKNINRTVVYNGIFINDFKDVLIKNKSESNFIIGTSGRFVGEKNIDRLIRAFATFSKGKNTELLLIGDGPLLKNLIELVGNLGISNKVIFTGLILDDNYRYHINLMNIAVIPSKYEAFGLVALETLLIGKPTLVFKDGGGLVEIIQGINPDDVIENEIELINRLEFYYGNPEIINDNAESRRNYVVNKFNIKSTADELNKIYLSFY